MNNKRYKIIIKISDKRGYNYQYIFIGKKLYIEYDIKRYLRIVNRLKDNIEIVNKC